MVTTSEKQALTRNITVKKNDLSSESNLEAYDVT